jgi:putative aminopeptidase FrvX
MKRILCFIVSVTIAIASYSQDIGSIINEVNLDSLVKTVREITGEEYTTVNGTQVLIRNRQSSNPGNELAKDYIKERLSKRDLDVQDQAYSSTGHNVIATQTGINLPDSIYIICAHYDAMADYCADDNGSGIAAVLEAARILSKYCFDYTIIYIAFDQEEQGQIGSTYYASQAFSNGYKIAGVLNMDMIAYDSNDDRRFEIHTNSLTSSQALKNALVSTINNYSLSLSPTVVNPGVTGSDHGPFWARGYGASCVSELFFHGDANPYYHTSSDRISRFNLNYFKELAKLNIGTLATVSKLNPSCQTETLSVSPDNQNVSASAGSTDFTVSSNTSWTISDNATWLTVSPASGTGNATITATFVANASTSARTATITVSGSGVSDQQATVTQEGSPTGVIDYEDNRVKIYPNPANSILVIEGLFDELQISIYDVQGRLVLKRKLVSNIIDIINLSPGIYSLVLEDKNRIVNKRFVKQ